MTTVHDYGVRTDIAPAADTSECVPELVRAQAELRPHRVAVSAGTRTLTYGALNARADALAAQLCTLGVGPEVPVGLCLPRSPEMVVSALGIMNAGGAYVPLDPSYPPDRLQFMLDDADAPVLITEPAIAARLPSADRQMLYPDRLADARSSAPPLPLAQTSPDALAYVIYTSGSTGRPKGVELTHRGLGNLVSWHNAAFAVTPADRASHVAGLGFDAAVWELWPYLAAGASVHLVDDDTRMSAELLREWLVAQGITIGFVPTPLAERLVTPAEAWPPESALRILLTGGDTLHHVPPAGLPFVLVNNYGPTECTVVATSGPIPPAGAQAVLPPPIGRPITNMRAYLLDERLTPVPQGEAGQLWIGGLGLARGYRNRPDLTAERFVPNPFAPDGGERLYRTGDLARELPDGQLAFVGRIDDQIKIRGYRVEPGEISAVLGRHPLVRESVIVAREETTGDKRLVAYLVLAPGTNPSVTELREFLRASLPDYMIPAAFVRVEAFPLTPNGKIDRAALAAFDADSTLEDDITTAPLTDTEQRIAEMLGELLHLEEIDLDDNFFMLGGHSLLGAQLIARLRQTFGVDLALRALFEAPTVAALSAEVDRLAQATQP